MVQEKNGKKRMAGPEGKQRRAGRKGPVGTDGGKPEEKALAGSMKVVQSIADYLVVTSPGLEEITCREMRDLGLTPGSVIPGGVEFRGSREEMFRANLHLRTASRILMRLACFKAIGFKELHVGIRSLPWEHFLNQCWSGSQSVAAAASVDTSSSSLSSSSVSGKKVGQSSEQAQHPVVVKVTCHQSRLYHTGKIEDTTLAAVGERLDAVLREQRGKGGGDGEGVQTIYLRIEQDQCHVSIDTSGELLHRRGYREVSGVAPIRENLAAAILMGCGWTGDSPLVDPFCGTGTFILEGAMIAARMAPGSCRTFAFEGWPSHQYPNGAAADALFSPHGNHGVTVSRSYKLAWEELKAQAESNSALSTCVVGPQKGVLLPPLQGSDLSSHAVAAAQANQLKGGLSSMESIVFLEQDFQYLQPPRDHNGNHVAPGLIVANPPYGDRVGSRGDVRRLYGRFAQILRDRFAGWHVGLLVPERSLVALFPFPKLGEPIVFNHGGKSVMLIRFRVD